MSTFTKRLSSLFAFARRGARFDPERDWALLLSTAGVALVLIVAWSIWAFQTVVGGGTLGDALPSTAATSSQTSLEAIPGLLAGRAAEDAKYVNGAYRFTDPSQ